MARNLKLGPVEATKGAAARRVAALVGGEPLWFESADTALDASAEALAGCVLMPAVAAGQRLEIAGPVSALWLNHLTEMMAIWRQWWGYPVLPPQAPTLPQPRPQACGTALCFTGGVDSFYTLLCGPQRPDLLLFVQGYDITLADSRRMSTWERSLREVATELGTRAVVLRTNLRLHPLAKRCGWNRWHGGPTAATGHLLAGQAGTLLISSSFPPSYGHRWGSHACLDPLWSSERLSVVHWGATHSRLGKIREIIGHDLVRQHLRVCWENRVADGNCSRCDKCLCTMALIALCGAHVRVPVFDWNGSLAEHLDRVPRTQFIYTYAELLEHESSGALATAIRALLERTAARVTFRERATALLQRLRRVSAPRTP